MDMPFLPFSNNRKKQAQTNYRRQEKLIKKKHTYAQRTAEQNFRRSIIILILTPIVTTFVTISGNQIVKALEWIIPQILGVMTEEKRIEVIAVYSETGEPHLREEASEFSKSLFRFSHGQIFKITNEVWLVRTNGRKCGRWYRAYYNGKEGYVALSQIRWLDEEFTKKPKIIGRTYCNQRH